MKSSLLQILFLIALVFIACAKSPVYPEAQQEGDNLIIDIKELKEAEPLFLTFTHDGKRINFLVLRINGEIQSFFDACAKCYPKKLGYRFIDGELRCMACGEQYSLDELRGVGSCYPLPLEGETREGRYFIRIDEVIKGKRYF